TVWIFARNLEHAFACADARMIAGRKRHVAQTDHIPFDQSPIVRVEVTLEQPADPFQFFSDIVKRFKTRFEHYVRQRAITHRRHRDRLLRAQPAFPAVTRWINTDLREPAMQWAVMTVLDALEVMPHLVGFP